MNALEENKMGFIRLRWEPVNIILLRGNYSEMGIIAKKLFSKTISSFSRVSSVLQSSMASSQSF